MQKQENEERRMISTSHSSKSLPRNLSTTQTRRQSTVSFGTNEIIHRKIDFRPTVSFGFLTNNSMGPRFQHNQNI